MLFNREQLQRITANISGKLSQDPCKWRKLANKLASESDCLSQLGPQGDHHVDGRVTNALELMPFAAGAGQRTSKSGRLIPPGYRGRSQSKLC